VAEFVEPQGGSVAAAAMEHQRAAGTRARHCQIALRAIGLRPVLGMKYVTSQGMFCINLLIVKRFTPSVNDLSLSGMLHGLGER
jgi:hypothetical protein